MAEPTIDFTDDTVIIVGTQSGTDLITEDSFLTGFAEQATSIVSSVAPTEERYGPGVVDAGFRGEINAILINHGPEPVVFNRGDRIAQLVVVPVTLAEFEEVEVLPDSVRGEGGFGSSGL